MELLMSSDRLYLVCLAVCFSLGRYASATPCSVLVNTDIVVAVADSKATMYHSWGGIVLSPGLVHFLKSFVTQCDYRKVRMSIVSVSNTVRLLAPFTSNPNDLHLAIQTWRPQFKGARTFLALRSIRSYFKTDARQNAARIAIVVTPQQSDNYFSTVSESLLLRADHVAVIGVGYGRFAPSQELAAMAGSRDRILITPNDYFLIYFVKPIKQLICKLSQVFQKKQTTVSLTTSTTTTTITTTTTTTSTTTTPTTTTTQTTTTTTTTTPMTTVGATMVDIMVLLDHSASTARFQGLNVFYNPAIIDWSNMFVDSLPLARCPVGFTVFESNVQTLQTITSDNAVLNGVINTLATDNTIPFSSSAVDLGITEATNQLINNGNAGANKVLVVLVDGSSNNDAATEAAAVAAENLGVETWVVTFPTLMGVAITETQLLAISRNPSRIISVNNDQELPPVATNLVTSVCP